jgi:hypothetical protein
LIRRRIWGSNFNRRNRIASSIQKPALHKPYTACAAPIFYLQARRLPAACRFMPFFIAEKRRPRVCRKPMRRG